MVFLFSVLVDWQFGGGDNGWVKAWRMLGRELDDSTSRSKMRGMNS